MHILQKSLRAKKKTGAARVFRMALLAAAITFTSTALTIPQQAVAATKVSQQVKKSKALSRKTASAKKAIRTSVKKRKRKSLPKTGNTGKNTASIELATAGGMARGLPAGLQLASRNVQVGCLKPALISLLNKVQNRFGRTVVITSGYRSPSHNRKVKGAKSSLHMSCAAADIQVNGVSKWEVAKFVRSLPNRGGVGTYSHKSVHVDIGPRRDWHWGRARKH